MGLRKSAVSGRPGRLSFAVCAGVSAIIRLYRRAKGNSSLLCLAGPVDHCREALEIAQARDFVERMEGQLDAPIAQGGTNVSGGQRQRLAIARTLVHRPEIYLFDDSFSALDYATDAALRAALTEHLTADGGQEATVVIVAQRVSTIRDADRIIVLDDGKVVGTGTHDELMETDPTYREIVLSQLTAEEAVTR